MDHNQDRQSILAENQSRTHVLSKEVLSLKEEKAKQVNIFLYLGWGTREPGCPTSISMQLSGDMNCHVRPELWLCGCAAFTFAASTQHGGRDQHPWAGLRQCS